ncbi:MAG TPA: hypothetical protein VI384_04295 [Candidatus Dormibacteraeota bacterium]
MKPITAEMPRIAWYDPGKKGEDCAHALYQQGSALEMAYRSRRYRHALLYRLVTGDEAPAMFNYWLTSGVGAAIGSLGLGNYVEPAINIVASALEVFENRIGTLRPFVQVLPQGGDFAIREACEKAEYYVDALFDSVRLYDTTTTCFRDAGTWGTTWIKVAPDVRGECVEIGRVLDDEILFDEAATLTGRPGSLIQRRFMPRDDANVFVDMAPSAERDVVRAAILAAPKAFAASFWGGSLPVEHIALLEGWKLPGADGKPGRHVLALPNRIINDDEWTRDCYPFAKMIWTRRSLGWRGGSLAHAMLPYQIKVNKWEERIDANGDRMAFSGWIIDQSVQLKAEALGGRPGRVIRKSGGGTVEPITVAANAPDAYAELERWIARGFQRVGLSQPQTMGEKQPGITSGKALRTMVQIEDARNQSLQIAIERLVKDVAELAVEAAEEINLRVQLPGVFGKSMSWSDLGLKDETRKIQVFPVSALPNDPAGRQQQIAEWYADGTINKRTYFRLQNMPDTTAEIRIMTAGDDLIDATLDEIVRTGKFVSPEPYDDMASAIARTQSRYWLEKRLGASRKVLRQLQAFMAALSTMMESGQQFLAPPAPAPGPGVVAPPGAPAAPPAQSAPTLPPPALPAAA